MDRSVKKSTGACLRKAQLLLERICFCSECRKSSGCIARRRQFLQRRKTRGKYKRISSSIETKKRFNNLEIVLSLISCARLAQDTLLKFFKGSLVSRAHEIWKILMQVSGFIDMVKKTSPGLVSCYLIQISRCTTSSKSGFFRLIFQYSEVTKSQK